MNAYVPRRDEVEVAEAKARAAESAVYPVLIICLSLITGIMGMALQLESYAKAKGIGHFDKVGLIRIIDAIK